MKCIICGGFTKVEESREREDGSRRRRYGCTKDHHFTSIEIPLTDEEMSGMHTEIRSEIMKIAKQKHLDSIRRKMK